MIYFVIFLSFFLTLITSMMYESGEKFATSYHIKKEIHYKKDLKQDLLIAKCTNQDTSFISLELSHLTEVTQ